MSGVQIEIRSKGASQAIKALLSDMDPATHRGIIKAALHVEYMLKTQVFETFPEGRTGALARSFKPVFLGRDQNVISAAVRSDLIYARIQDEGGTITPKSVKRIAVPINKRIAIGKWPRHFAKGELTYVPRKGKPPLLVKISGKKKERWTPMFVLVPSVTIRGRGYIERARRRAEPGVTEIIGGEITKIAKKADG